MIKRNINKEETMEKNEVESYADVKEYLIAKGLYERVLNLWEEEEEYESFSDLFTWAKTKEGVNYWTLINEELIDLNINKKIEPLVQDYKAKQGKEFIEHIEVQHQRIRKNNTSGFVGINWHKGNNKWVAKIKVNKIVIHLGYFNSVQEAVEARDIYIIENKLPHKLSTDYKKEIK